MHSVLVKQGPYAGTVRKQCSTCKVEKSVEEYWRNSSAADGLQAQCKPCKRAGERHYVANNAEKRREHGRLSYTRHRDKRVEEARVYNAKHKDKLRTKHLKRRFGKTNEDYLALLKSQNGGCAICFSTSPGQNQERFCWDHCHSTGALRSLLCWSCNRGLGSFVDDPERLERAAEYLRRWRSKS